MREANARLIAAAPDLLEAAKALQEARRIHNLNMTRANADAVGSASDDLSAAIAEAEGYEMTASIAHLTPTPEKPYFEYHLEIVGPLGSLEGNQANLARHIHMAHAATDLVRVICLESALVSLARQREYLDQLELALTQAVERARR